MRFIQIDQNNNYVGECFAEVIEGFTPPDGLIAYDGSAEPGQQWNGTQFIVPADNRPVITLNSVAFDNTDTQTLSDLPNHKIGVTSGKAFTVNAACSVPVTGSFYMPIRATDGREIVTVLNLVNGAIAKTITINERGIWEIQEALINRELPENQQFKFAGLRIFVV